MNDFRFRGTKTAGILKWNELSERIIYLSKTTAAADREKAECASIQTSEYQIGHTTYKVTTVLNPAFQESFTEILNRLILRDCEKFLGETGQEPEMQAV